MKAKKKRERNTDVVHTDDNHLALLKATCLPYNSPIYEFLEASDMAHQMAALKKISGGFKNREFSTECLESIIAVMVNVYLSAPVKNQLKRAVGSFLQMISCEHEVGVQRCLKAQILAMLVGSAERRTVVDNLASLLENFPAGEKSICSQWFEIVNFLSCTLAHFYSEVGKCSGPMQITATMHDCLATVQVLNKVLQKSAPVVASSADTRTHEMELKLHKTLSSICSHVWQILSDDHFLMDCRGACGMVLPLLVKIVAHDDLVSQIRDNILPGSGDSPAGSVCFEWLSSPVCKTIPVLSRLCLVSGTLAMLDVSDLVKEYQTGAMLLTDHIAPMLLELTHSVSDTNTKLMASRTLVMWSQKARSALDVPLNESTTTLRDRLQGNADIPSKLLEYTWNHWEDPVDIIRYQARIIFENLLKCHLLASGEDAKTSKYICGLVASLLSMGADVKGKYGPLTCLVDHVGAATLLHSRPTLPQDLLAALGEQTLAAYVSELFEKLFTNHRQELFTGVKVSTARRVKTPAGRQDLPTGVGDSPGGVRETPAGIGHSPAGGGDLPTGVRDSPAGEGDSLELWYHTWLDPVLDVLCSGTKQQKTQVIEYTVPKLLKCCPDSITYVTANLAQQSTGGEKLGAVVTCLKRAKIMGILKQFSVAGDHSLWHGVVSTSVVQQALCHHDSQVRLDAFGLLCENHKTTEVISPADLDLVCYFLPRNLCSQEPAFRQQLVALLKKLLIRLKEGGQALCRHAVAGKGKAGQQAQTDLHRYTAFLSWLMELLFSRLHPGAAFPSRTTAISLLVTMTTIFSIGDRTANSLEFHLVDVLSAEHIQTLIECFTDTFEQNKTEAFAVLRAVPLKYLGLQSETRLQSLFEAGLELSSSTKPQDCTTAAYVLKTLLLQPELLGIVNKCLQESTNLQPNEGIESPISSDLKAENAPNPTGSGSDGSENGKIEQQVNSVRLRSLKVLQLLLTGLEEQLGVARRSLLHAAATRPLYPTLHCVRYILEDTDLSSVSSCKEWRELLSSLIQLCYEVAQVVSPVVSNSSPEGNIPVDALPEGILGPGLEVEALVPESERHLLQAATESAHTVSLMPEYLVVCCWRSIKEVSLTLGQLTMTAPLIDPEGDPFKGLLSVNQLHSLGDYFTVQLLESRHRGAFELAYAGFVKMTSMLWRCPIVGVHQLPAQWLTQILADVKSGDPNSKLCSTRRSAGVPFYVQALVSTEPALTGRSCFKHLMSELLALAQPPNASPSQENTAQVHSLNILRALYRDNRLGEDVFPYLAEGLKAAILGYASQLWAIRNSSSLLFSALMVRIFGVKRSRDEMSRKNCMTGRVFFHRFPALFQFLLTQLESATEDIGSSGRYQLHPGLYPVLMVLGRLYPSVIEGADANINIAAFIPHIVRCAGSPVFKTRLMAARALQPIVGKDQVVSTLSTLIARLPWQPDQHVPHNLIHGTLLQVCHLLEEVEHMPASLLPLVEDVVISGVMDCQWLGTSQNKCFVTRQAFMEVAFCTCNIPWTLMNPQREVQLHTLLQTVITLAYAEVAVNSHNTQLPGVIEYIQVLNGNFLRWLEKNCDNLDHASSVMPDSLEQILCTLLSRQLYEVKIQTMEVLLRAVTSRQPLLDLDPIHTNCDTTPGLGVIADAVAGSTALIGHLVAMVMDHDYHPDCLCLSAQVLSHLPGTLCHGNQPFSTCQIFQRLLFLQSHARDEVRCAAFHLSATVLPSIIKHMKQVESDENVERMSLLSEWLNVLQAGCSTQGSVEARLTSARALVHNATDLLLDSPCALGEHVFQVWTVLVRLLQDEDPHVRQVAAQVLQPLHACIPPEFNEVCLEDMAVQPELVLEICVIVMVNQLRGHHWSACVHTLLSWIQDDLEPDWPQQECEVRLFDKGEMNTYQDSINFVHLVAKQLTSLLSPQQCGNHNNHQCHLGNQVQATGASVEGITAVTEVPPGGDDIVHFSYSPRLQIDSSTSVKDKHNPNVPNSDSDSPADGAIVSCNSTQQRNLQSRLLTEAISGFQETLRSLSPVTAKCPLVRTWAYNDFVISLCRKWTAVRCLQTGLGTDSRAAENSGTAELETLRRETLAIFRDDTAMYNFVMARTLMENS